MMLQQGLQDCHSAALPPRPKAVIHRRPVVYSGGLVVTCPHSGRFYPPELQAASRLDAIHLRRSEDAFVDELLADAPLLGADLLINPFARAFVDVNRPPGDLDGAVISGLLPDEAAPASANVQAGLGVIPRTIGEGIVIHKRPISREAALARIGEVYQPWHAALAAALGAAHARNGVAILLDCHSMPSHAAGTPVCDIILGDRFGHSCAPAIAEEASACLRALGLRVGRNNPYAGGYATEHYGQVRAGHHALQIEINRALYMVEGALTLRPDSAKIRAAMTELVGRLIDLSVDLAKGQ